jgi:hypothetical protein
MRVPRYNLRAVMRLWHWHSKPVRTQAKCVNLAFINAHI